MAGIGIIQNRRAGQKRGPFRGRIGKKLGYVLGDPGSMHETSRVEEIAHVAREFFQRDVDIVGIGGGDGSNHYVLDGLVKAYGEKPLPKIAFLCGGTHNAHAKSIGVEGEPAILLQNIVRKYHTGARFDMEYRVLLRIDDGQRVHHGFSLATGFMQRFYEELVSRRTDSAAKVATQIAAWAGNLLSGGSRLRQLFRLEPARVRVDGQELVWPEINGVSCSGMEMLGLGFKPYVRASETPRTFHVGVLKCKARAFLRFMVDYRRGRIPVHPDSYSNIASRMDLEMDGPISYVLDGELYRGGSTLKVETGPRLHLIAG